MNLLAKTIAYLQDHSVRAALIGGAALAAHGIIRATLDYDLLVVDRSVLDEAFWAAWPGAEQRDIRHGDADDPLAGVVRTTHGNEAVDLVVGRHAWEASMLARSVAVTVEGHSVWAVDKADLVLLKLSAGGPQDLLDVRLLLAADTGALRREVDRRVVGLPTAVQAAWKAVAS